MLRVTARMLVLTMALSLSLVVQGGQRPSAEPGCVTVQLLAINDFHGNLEPPSGSNGRVNATAAGGAEYLATHLTNDIAQNPNSIVVAAGDLIGASPFVSSIFHDEPTIEAMNAMHLAVSSVGNHEFDKGLPALLRVKRVAAFQYLSANVIRTSTHMPVFPATTIRTVAGVKVGFIGETLQGTKQIVAARATRGLTFLDEAITANTYAARLKRQGVHAIVLLVHEGGAQRPAGGSVDPNGCVNPGGVRADLVAGSHRAMLQPGAVTYKDVYEVQPFGNVLTVITMTGDMIKRLLEQQFDNPSPGDHKILQVLSGFTYRYRLTAPAGQHVDADFISIDGRRIAPTDKVRVAASDFLVGGGDGFSVFKEGTNKVASMGDIDALVAYFKARSPVAPPRGRILKVD